MKITKVKKGPEKIKMRTRSGDDAGRGELAEWWLARDDQQLAKELCGTASYLKTSQVYRLRQLSVNVRLYSGLSVYSYAGSNVQKMDKTILQQVESQLHYRQMPKIDFVLWC